MHLQRRFRKSSDLLICEKGSATTDENEKMDEKRLLIVSSWLINVFYGLDE